MSARRHRANGEVIPDVLLARLTCSKTKEWRCLPTIQPQSSTKRTGHFDPFDLARRLEIHQAQCRRADKLRQRKDKQLETAESMAKEGDNASTSRDSDNVKSSGRSRSTRGPRSTSQSRNDVATRMYDTNAGLLMPNLALVTQVRQAEDNRLQQRKVPKPGHRKSGSRTSIERSKALRDSSYITHDKQRSISQHSARVEPYRESRQDGIGMDLTSKAQPFKMYTQEISLSSRPKTVALNVPGRAASKSSGNIKDGPHVPGNAASGLAKTTTPRTEKRSNSSKTIPQTLAPDHEASKGSLGVAGRGAREKTSSARTERSIKGVSMSDEGTRRGKDASRSAVEMSSASGACQKSEYQSNIVNGASLTEGRHDETGHLVPINDPAECERNGKPRRTLRKKLSSMRWLSRTPQDEDAGTPPERVPDKPAISRRRSMLVIFRSS